MESGHFYELRLQELLDWVSSSNDKRLSRLCDCDLDYLNSEIKKYRKDPSSIPSPENNPAINELNKGIKNIEGEVGKARNWVNKVLSNPHFIPKDSAYLESKFKTTDSISHIGKQLADKAAKTNWKG